MMLATLLRGRLPKERSHWAGLQPVPGHRGRWPQDSRPAALGVHRGPRRFYRAQGFVPEPPIFGSQGGKVVIDPLASIPPYG